MLLRRILLLCGAIPALVLASAEKSFVVATLKVMPVTGDKAANFAVFEKMARRAAAAGADFVVTPEGYLDGYLGSPKIVPGITHEKLVAAADSIDGPWLTKVAALAKDLKIHVLFGFTERDGDQAHNTVALFAPDGSLAGRYAKTHTMPGGEIYDPGHELKVFDTALGRMGVLICFDRQPPENARVLALRGAQFIVVPAYGKTSTPMDEDVLLRVRAYENGLYVIYTSPRNTFVADPDGEIVSQIRSNDDEMLFTKVTLDDRIGDRHALQIRHPDLYGRLLEPAGK
ncbi:MAG TPA: carbon-nitrogen hydrolase family protein [Lacunisphaera sp.]|nr:carbon-nitrogen hydrolase family protein [Lacunisphaera sp.]